MEDTVNENSFMQEFDFINSAIKSISVKLENSSIQKRDYTKLLTSSLNL